MIWCNNATQSSSPMRTFPVIEDEAISDSYGVRSSHNGSNAADDNSYMI